MHIIKTLDIFVRNALTVNGYSLTKKLNNGYTKSKNTAYLYTFHNFADSSSAGSSRSHAFCESEWCIFFKARLHCFICPRSRRLTGSQGWIRRAETYEISGKQIQRGTLCFVFYLKWTPFTYRVERLSPRSLHHKIEVYCKSGVGSLERENKIEGSKTYCIKF